jgi:hypothetical protein
MVAPYARAAWYIDSDTPHPYRHRQAVPQRGNAGNGTDYSKVNRRFGNPNIATEGAILGQTHGRVIRRAGCDRLHEKVVAVK